MPLRPATTSDARTLFAWANDPETRAQSFSSDPIEWDGHVAWFGKVIDDPDRTLWLLEDDGRPVASIRFDADRGRALVSVQVAPEARGRGFGRRVVGEASRLYVSATGRALDAEIKADNAASVAVFQAAGFRRVDDLSDGSLRYVLD